MKNLKLSSSLSFGLKLQSEEETLLLSAFDIDRSRLFFASSANIVYSFEVPSSQKDKSWSKSVILPQFAPVFLEPGDIIAAIDYLMEKEALVLGTENGCLILHSMDENTTEVVGRVEGGVKSISCSPDGALLAITSGIGQLLVMTNDWEVLHENPLNLKNVVGDADDYSNHFHAPISWRGDGKYFATLGGLHECSLKKLRIWESESGLLHSETEAKAFVGAALDWMPSGAKVTAAYECNIGIKPHIVFFEKNGLERNSLPIDEPSEISFIKWNCSSDLLATSVTCIQHDAIKIWFFSNYHWYLKQEIRYSKREGVKFMWNPSKPMQLICWTLNGIITTYNFVWTTAITDNSTALVVDNSKLLVSPLIMSLMPPPMSLFTLKFSTAVQDVTFINNNSKYRLAACLSDGGLSIMELPEIDSWVHFEDKEFGIENASSNFMLGTFSHIMWLDSHLLLGVSFNQYDFCSTTLWSENELNHQKLNCSQGYSLLEIEVQCSEDFVPELINSSGWLSTLSKSLPLESLVIGIVSNPCKKASAFIQMEGGSIFEYTASTFLPSGPQFHELDPEYGFSASCPWMKAASVCNNGLLKALLFGLDHHGKLHFGKRVLCSSCSSFTLYSSSFGGTEHTTHLIFTTKQDLLFIVNIDDILNGNKEIKIEDYDGMQNRRDKNRDYINMWERGAKLIGALHGDEAAVVLQTNRGNLECIYPRKLVLDSTLNALSQKRFKNALAMVRRHRIDFNFIIDCFGWQSFVKSAVEFVNQVDNLAHVTEFVTSIKSGNVMNILYKDYIFPSLPNKTSNTSVESSSSVAENKVNSVLWAIRKALEEQLQESPARELCILTTLARNEPPALEEALNRIKSVREMEVLGINDAKRMSYPSAEESLKHLLWLADPEAIFETALGLYDLNLAAIVALNSQKDPKEFLPYLKELEILPCAIMRYTIDLRLQRYESALKHMFSAGESHHEECLNLMKNSPQLFPLGLQLFAKNVKRMEILEAWGDHLYNEKCFQDAASAYLCCSSLEKALKAYRGCGDWKGVLTVAGLLGLGEADIIQLAYELCEEFQALGRPVDAARIALEYCKDVGRCVGYYIMAREWEEALRISYMHKKLDIMLTVEEAALECTSSLISDYKEASEKVGKYLARYLAVRQRRLVLAAKIQSEGRLTENADYDNVSETSSNFSQMSAYTTRTAKDSVTSTSSTTRSKAREIRRKANKGGKIRAGSPGEEMALIEHLKGMALTDGAQRELKSLLVTLLMLRKEDLARQLQCAGDNFQLTHHSAVKLTEVTISTDKIDENTHTLEYYTKKVRESWHSQAHSWQIKILPLP